MKVGHINLSSGDVAEIFRGDYMSIEAYRYFVEVNQDKEDSYGDISTPRFSYVCYSLIDCLDFIAERAEEEAESMREMFREVRRLAAAS